MIQCPICKTFNTGFIEQSDCNPHYAPGCYKVIYGHVFSGCGHPVPKVFLRPKINKDEVRGNLVDVD